MRLAFLFFLLFCSSLSWSMGQVPTDMDSSPLIGKTAPDAVLIKSDGTSASIMAARQGEKAVLIFWATWCPHCYDEMGHISQNLGAIEQKGIKIILIDLGEDKNDVKSYFNQRHMTLVSFVDSDSTLQETYRLIGVPTLFFIDEKGIVRNMTHEFPAGYQKYFSS